ncbi:MAG: glycosyltransferase family 4 protein [Acidobacteriota bacterium]
MIIEQFLPAFHYGDATSNSALAFHNFLLDSGIESRLISLTSDKSMRDKVILFKDYKEDRSSLKILHFAIPSLLTDFFLNVKGKKVMIYHNITPSHFFADYSSFLTGFTEEGRKHLEKLKDCFDLSIGVSKYNVSDLEELGFKNATVFPLIIDLKDYDKKYSRGFYNLIKDERKNILCVGRVAPNKKLEDAVKMLFFYKKYLSPSIRLIIAGNIESVPRYFFAVRDLASRFYLTSEDIIFTGHIKFDEFLSVYKASDVYLSVSEHEGFCLPVIESFKMGVPVVAYGAGAINETVGDGGIILSDKDPELTAGTLEYVIGNEKLRNDLLKSGQNKLNIYKESSNPEKLLNILKKI